MNFWRNIAKPIIGLAPMDGVTDASFRYITAKHAIISGGNVPLGGGTSIQKKWGVADSPDLVFQDLTDWSVVEPNGAADYRYNDREIIRAFADNCAKTCEFLIAHGVVFVDKAPDTIGGGAVGNSVPREMHCAPMAAIAYGVSYVRALRDIAEEPDVIATVAIHSMPLLGHGPARGLFDFTLKTLFRSAQSRMRAAARRTTHRATPDGNDR